MASAPASAADVKAVRAFNRFYTQRIGVLDRYLGSEFSLTEVRVLYELAHRKACTASALVRDIGLDAGYLSRILRRYQERGWIARDTSPQDARQSLLKLTAAGHAAFAPLQQRSREESAALLATVPAGARAQLVAAMDRLQRLLDPGAAPKVALRDLQPGDIGWVVQQHGEIYAREYGWNHEFEAMVAVIAGRFIQTFKPGQERAWIAEVDGERAGSVFVVRKSATVAQLRLLILTPQARGHGLGARLTDEAIAFAKDAGYRKMTLWTNANLDAARHIYAQRGFACVKSEPYTGYGGNALVGETWERKL